MQWEEVRLIQTGVYTFRLLRSPHGTYKSEPLPLLRQDEGIPIISRERKLLGIFESASSPGTKHYVYLEFNGKLSCTCHGFRSPDKCWHYRGMIEVLKTTPPDKITEPLIINLPRR